MNGCQAVRENGSNRRNRVGDGSVQHPSSAAGSGTSPLGSVRRFERNSTTMSDDPPSLTNRIIQAKARRTPQASHLDERFNVPLRGVEVGPETRCVHYHGPRDVIAIRFACCGVFYPCHACHVAVADHDAERWSPDRFDTRAVRCGDCGTVLTIEQYVEADHACSTCGTAFNPRCARHYDRYFEVR